MIFQLMPPDRANVWRNHKRFCSDLLGPAPALALQAEIVIKGRLVEARSDEQKSSRHHIVGHGLVPGVGLGGLSREIVESERVTPRGI